MNEVDAASSGATEEAPVVIAVVRTGGIAGMHRRWRVVPSETERDGWVELVERCPWDEPIPEEDGQVRDRYIWRIDVRLQERQRDRELPESALTGAWRELVDAVREAPRE